MNDVIIVLLFEIIVLSLHLSSSISISSRDCSMINLTFTLSFKFLNNFCHYFFSILIFFNVFDEQFDTFSQHIVFESFNKPSERFVSVEN